MFPRQCSRFLTSVHDASGRANACCFTHYSCRALGLCFAGVRMKAEDRTAYIFLPGGLGTLDEFFEVSVFTCMGEGVQGGCTGNRGTLHRASVFRDAVCSSCGIPPADPDAGAAAQARNEVPGAHHHGVRSGMCCDSRPGDAVCHEPYC